jgi:hypothetical protein
MRKFCRCEAQRGTLHANLRDRQLCIARPSRALPLPANISKAEEWLPTAYARTYVGAPRCRRYVWYRGEGSTEEPY